MISFKEGNILESRAEALINTVNTVGVMGKGIALQFKNAFPLNFKLYQKACKEKTFDVGQILVSEESTLNGKKIIINFPTKKDWRKPSEYEYIEKGLIALRNFIIENNIESIAIPPLGAGNGGLEWNRVKKMIIDCLGDLNCEIIIYEPNSAIIDKMKTERASLTPARAMLLSVLYDLVRNGEFISEFSSEKIAYFLQRFGAFEEFKLEYKPYYYGPYSGKVKRVLYHLNGSYIMGYSSMNAKPFEELQPIMDAEKNVIEYLNKEENKKYNTIVDQTKEFFSGFYSNFALELLSSIDYIIRENKTNDIESIKDSINKWSQRKSKLFSKDQYISIAVEHINSFSDKMLK
ncbi:MAG: Appr-1-p processing protein [Bacteroidetes bacterium]|nr:Appr-1-p processing protein [Bacteroidota bacterium]